MVSRRDIFKFAGAGAGGVGVGLLLGEVNQRPLETLLSTHIPPEDFSPGVDTWYNTLCRMCPAGCGISVKVREGRAKKIEGNAAHPVSRGGTCALGQAALNALYNPDRLRSPMRADGEGGFVPASWDEAFEELVSRLTALEAVGMGGRVWVLTGGALSSGEEALSRFAGALNARVLRPAPGHNGYGTGRRQGDVRLWRAAALRHRVCRCGGVLRRRLPGFLAFTDRLREGVRRFSPG